MISGRITAKPDTGYRYPTKHTVICYPAGYRNKKWTDIRPIPYYCPWYLFELVGVKYECFDDLLANTGEVVL